MAIGSGTGNISTLAYLDHPLPLRGTSDSFVAVFQHHSKEGKVLLLRGAERAGEALAHPRREAGVAPFRLLHDPHRRGTVTDASAVGLVDAQTEHFVAEALAMSATLPFRELPDVRHLMEQDGDERTRVAARADVQREGDPAVDLSVDGRCLRIGIAGHVRWPSAAVQDHRHGRERPAPAVMVAEAVKPVEMAIDVLEHRVERRQMVKVPETRQFILQPLRMGHRADAAGESSLGAGNAADGPGITAGRRLALGRPDKCPGTGERTRRTLLLPFGARPFAALQQKEALLKRRLDGQRPVLQRHPLAVHEAEAPARGRDALEKVRGLRALDDVAVVLPLREPKAAAAHLDGRQAARVPREDCLHVGLVESHGKHGDVRDDAHTAGDEVLQLPVLVAFRRHNLAGHAGVRHELPELVAFQHSREEGQRLAPVPSRVQIGLGDDLRAVVRQQIRMDRTQKALADQPVDGAGRHRILERELHAVRPEGRRRKSEDVFAPHLLVEEDAGLRRLVVRLVQNDEVGLGRHPLEE